MIRLRHPNLAALLSDLTGLAFYHSLFSWLIGTDIELIHAELAHGKLISDEAMAEALPYPVTYNADYNALIFPAAFLSRSVFRTSADLTPLLEERPFGQTARTILTQTLSQTINAIMDSALTKGQQVPSLEAIAGQLSQSIATVRRRLAEEHTSYRSIKESCQLRHANRLLTGTALPLGAIANIIGYGDVSAFNYAYKRWCGRSPSAFRRLQSTDPPL